MLDYKLLEAMATVLTEGGFDRAARALYLTQSAVSQRIKLLEEQTGQVLLIRESPPRATLAGQRLLRHYLQVQRLEDDLPEDFLCAAADNFVSLAIGINADSLATWFPEAVQVFIRDEKVVLDIRTDDQEQTHHLLKNGEVAGCISIREQPMQGCRTVYLGKMDYRMFASPDFAGQWFDDGLTAESVSQAPALIYNRKDDLHNKLYEQVIGAAPTQLPAHYVPSSEKFAFFISAGIGYGMLPDQQSAALETAGKIVNLAPAGKVAVRLYWHCWNIKSRLLERLTRTLVDKAGELLSK